MTAGVPARPAPATGDPVTEWQQHLDRLELEVQWTERLLIASRALDAWEWEPPAVASPLPAELLPRARAIHARQRALAQRLAAAMQQSHHQQAFVDTALGTTAGPSRYVDLSA